MNERERGPAAGFSLMLIVGEIRERQAEGLFALPGEKSLD